MPCLFLNTEWGFGGKPPKNRGFVGILRGQKCLKRGQKCLKRRFSRRSPVGEWSRGTRCAAAWLSGRGLQTRRHGQRGGDRARDLPPLCRTRLGPVVEGGARTRRDQS